MKSVQGFTLIELVSVIVIIGILAITAVPRFISLSTDARIATLQGMEIAMRSGTRMIFTKALINNQITGVGSITIGETTIQLHSGYPVGNWQQGIRYIINLDNVSFSRQSNTICNIDWCGRGSRKSIPSGKSTTSPGRIGKVYSRGYSWNDECGVYYINHENGSEPEIGLETNDC